jgi:hypothetical protein
MPHFVNTYLGFRAGLRGALNPTHHMYNHTRHTTSVAIEPFKLAVAPASSNPLGTFEHDTR